jgi:hypothetical protein
LRRSGREAETEGEGEGEGEAEAEAEAEAERERERRTGEWSGVCYLSVLSGLHWRVFPGI